MNSQAIIYTQLAPCVCMNEWCHQATTHHIKIVSGYQLFYIIVLGDPGRKMVVSLTSLSLSVKGQGTGKGESLITFARFFMKLSRNVGTTN